MMDRVSKRIRSAIMASVGTSNTRPELTVRSLLFAEGFRYVLNKKGLIGRPDIVLRKYKTVVFVNGCFWHGHDCKKGRRPRSNTAYWNRKIDQNILRDKRIYRELRSQGWSVFVVWQCRLFGDTQRVLRNLKRSRLNMGRHLSRRYQSISPSL